MDSSANSAPVPAGSPTSDSETEVDDSSRFLEDAPDHDRSIDRCVTCGEPIETDDYRLSRIVETAVTTVEAHYCSEECFPEQSRAETVTRTDGPRDFSYCR
ncbi:hypothetical protein AArcMg_2751 [Natrarchaeobaculum sulfurireducens]|uniref:Metal-binding protein n=1 Tax=Natrarchaeobaculum sulfurireducens TaxID=2044521 RepID=A0A346PCQ1_9EURY|nr:Metal-binding protein [Natrarchaeobaculum sulfurireducens]AXR82741.1 hypothetical protein AArcMg_2751 [Natrarchaeobaculum sulfurireducens]